MINRINKNKLIQLVVLVLLSVLSFAMILKYATNAANCTDIIKILDNKKMAAMGLSTTIVGTSTALAAIPGDATMAIASAFGYNSAQDLRDISNYAWELDQKNKCK